MPEHLENWRNRVLRKAVTRERNLRRGLEKFIAIIDGRDHDTAGNNRWRQFIQINGHPR